MRTLLLFLIGLFLLGGIIEGLSSGSPWALIPAALLAIAVSMELGRRLGRR